MKSQNMLAALLALTFTIAGCDKAPYATSAAGTDNRQAAASTQEKMMDSAPPAAGMPPGTAESPSSSPSSPAGSAGSAGSTEPSATPPADGAAGTQPGSARQGGY
jgi:hypothetical protein